MKGFKQFQKTDITITANQAFNAGDLRLEVGATSETVEVKAQGEQVQSTSAERSGLLDSKADDGPAGARPRRHGYAASDDARRGQRQHRLAMYWGSSQRRPWTARETTTTR